MAVIGSGDTLAHCCIWQSFSTGKLTLHKWREKNQAHARFFHGIICIGTYWIIHVPQTRQKKHPSKRDFSLLKWCTFLQGVFCTPRSWDLCVHSTGMLCPSLRNLWFDGQVQHPQTKKTVEFTAKYEYATVWGGFKHPGKLPHGWCWAGKRHLQVCFQG